MVASGYIDLVVEADLKAYDVGGLIPWSRRPAAR
jgi:fructose-1,6-bisphosphatase/inositol monophosphatase family enzyme